MRATKSSLFCSSMLMFVIGFASIAGLTAMIVAITAADPHVLVVVAVMIAVVVALARSGDNASGTNDGKP